MSDEMETQLKIISLARCLYGFGLHDLKQLLSVSYKAVWKAGEDIFQEGDSGRDMYILCAGKVSIWRKTAGERIDLAHLAPGESFGEMGLVDVGKRSAGAQALEDTLALRISYGRLSEAPEAAALLYRNIAKALAERLTIANDIIIFQTQHGTKLSPLEVTGKYRSLR
ncbi:MAG: cyclic nucleotide-binding domain-containing protein [Nitrosomonadales bacterium]|nr:cyclic nucleotide-binding domain-containing protein [Nitrosomonadales bacterium]